MKIFPRPSKTLVDKPASSTPSRPSGPKKSSPAKKEMSSEEVKEKLAAHTETAGAAKKMALLESKKLGEGFLSEEAPAVNTDLASNDPRDSNTQEKLKTVLSKGAFNFNPKERETLEKILS